MAAFSCELKQKVRGLASNGQVQAEKSTIRRSARGEICFKGRGERFIVD